jgi:hypothetical protein
VTAASVAASVAVVGRAGRARAQIRKALHHNGYQAVECAELSIASRFAGVIVIEEPERGERLRRQVLSWIKLSRGPRVVVISPRPVAWRPALLAHPARLHVLAAPSFSWEIIDALRGPPAAPAGRP